MTANKRTSYERTSRDRATMRAAATLLGWQTLDILGAYLTPEGETVVITKDGKRYGASSRPVGDLPTAEPMPEDEVAAQPRQKKVYAPKSWPATNWNALVEDIREKEGRLTKETVKQAYRKFQGITEKMISHADAVLDNLPDVPDWADHLPLATES